MRLLVTLSSAAIPAAGLLSWHWDMAYRICLSVSLASIRFADRYSLKQSFAILLKVRRNDCRTTENDESAQTFSELLKINHNFVKPHEGLDGKTPAQAVRIDSSLGKDKYMDLIKQAGNKPNFMNNLGKRIRKVTIVNEGDSIKITTKEVMDKSIWREINYILRLHGFSWHSQGKDSCWFKLNS